MLLTVIGRDIYLTRGDSAALRVKIAQQGCGKPYELFNGDEVFFTVKESSDLESFVIQKKITYDDLTENEIIFKLSPSDTNNLVVKDYIYDVEIKTSVGDVYTIIIPSMFRIEPEVTYALNEVNMDG